MERSAQEIRAAVEQLKLLNADPVVRDIAFQEQWNESIKKMDLKYAEDKGIENRGKKTQKGTFVPFIYSYLSSTGIPVYVNAFSSLFKTLKVPLTRACISFSPGITVTLPKNSIYFFNLEIKYSL